MGQITIVSNLALIFAAGRWHQHILVYILLKFWVSGQGYVLEVRSIKHAAKDVYLPNLTDIKPFRHLSEILTLCAPIGVLRFRENIGVVLTP